jgi:protein SCO1/2
MNTGPNRFAHRLSLVALATLGAPNAALAKSPSADPHAHCAAQARASSGRSTAKYQVPDVGLVRSDGARVNLRRELDDGKPVILNFIFTTCAAVCPVMSQTFSQIEHRLGEARQRVHLMSVSIDPEEDTPARLRAYAKKFDAGPEWSFYTGTLEASISAQRAFDAYRGDKMNHVPVTFLRVAPGEPWVRLEGFTKADDVIAEVRKRLGE